MRLFAGRRPVIALLRHLLVLPQGPPTIQLSLEEANDTSATLIGELPVCGNRTTGTRRPLHGRRLAAASLVCTFWRRPHTLPSHLALLLPLGAVFVLNDTLHEHVAAAIEGGRQCSATLAEAIRRAGTAGAAAVCMRESAAELHAKTSLHPLTPHPCPVLSGIPMLPQGSGWHRALPGAADQLVVCAAGPSSQLDRLCRAFRRNCSVGCRCPVCGGPAPGDQQGCVEWTGRLYIRAGKCCLSCCAGAVQGTGSIRSPAPLPPQPAPALPPPAGRPVCC